MGNFESVSLMPSEERLFFFFSFQYRMKKGRKWDMEVQGGRFRKGKNNIRWLEEGRGVEEGWRWGCAEMRWINTSKMVEEDVHCTLPRERECWWNGEAALWEQHHNTDFSVVADSRNGTCSKLSGLVWHSLQTMGSTTQGRKSERERARERERER